MSELKTEFALKIELTPAKPIVYKSRSREQMKRREIVDSEEALFVSPTNTTTVIQEGGTSYSQVFPDTAVALKPLTTPARAKKQKPTLDLGITPLNHETTSRTQATSTVSAPTQVVTDSVTQTPANVGVSLTLPKEPTQQLSTDNVISNEDVTKQDCIHNMLFGHMDQFGNLVKVQGPTESTVESRDVFVLATECSIASTHHEYLAFQPPNSTNGGRKIGCVRSEDET